MGANGKTAGENGKKDAARRRVGAVVMQGRGAKARLERARKAADNPLRAAGDRPGLRSRISRIKSGTRALAVRLTPSRRATANTKKGK